MKIQTFIKAIQGEAQDTRSRSRPIEKKQVAGEDRWEPSSSMMARVGLASASLTLICGSLTQPVMAAPRDRPQFQPPLDNPSLLQAHNGPKFSPSGRGHIVTIVGIEGDRVRFADPAHGKIRETTKDEIHRSPSYPQGSFIFLPSVFASS